MERCGEHYIPVGFGTYAAELGSDSDEANDAKARRRGCMEQRLKPPNRDPKRKPRAQKNPAPPQAKGEAPRAPQLAPKSGAPRARTRPAAAAPRVLHGVLPEM